MVLGACYTVFDGTELLEKSIRNICEDVNFIVVCYQNVSNTGKKSKIDLAHALDYLTIHSDIYLIEYKVDLPLGPKENERRKHNQMVAYARDLGCTHAIMMACDHFYDRQELRKAKVLVEAEDQDLTITEMFTYYKKPTWRLYPTESYYMPFIFKLYPHTKIERVKNFPYYVDPSVQMNTWKKYKFLPDVMLHHYSMCRKDIREKFENAASSWSEEKIKTFLDEYARACLGTDDLVYFPGKKLVEFPDIFELSGIFE